MIKVFLREHLMRSLPSAKGFSQKFQTSVEVKGSPVLAEVPFQTSHPTQSDHCPPDDFSTGAFVCGRWTLRMDKQIHWHL